MSCIFILPPDFFKNNISQEGFVKMIRDSGAVPSLKIEEHYFDFGERTFKTSSYKNYIKTCYLLDFLENKQAVLDYLGNSQSFCRLDKFVVSIESIYYTSTEGPFYTLRFQGIEQHEKA